MQIDDLLAKLNDAQAEVDRVREEKDQEIGILQESVDSAIQQLGDAQQVNYKRILWSYRISHNVAEPRSGGGDSQRPD